MSVIRDLKSSDARAMRAVYLDLLHGTFTHFPADAVEQYAADWTPDLIAARVAAGRHILLGAFQPEGEAIGLLFGAPPDGGVGTIIWLGVTVGDRGRGIGESLMRAAFASYRRRGCHKVKVYTETEAAKRFYLRIGMSAEGFHPRHWFGVNFWSLGIQL